MGMTESWRFTLGNGVSVSGETAQATRVRVEVQEPGSGQPGDDAPPPYASAWVHVDDWREMVLAVEQKLIRQGDPQR